MNVCVCFSPLRIHYLSTRFCYPTLLRDDGLPFLCLFDIEHSVEFPTLLRHLYNIGISSKGSSRIGTRTLSVVFVSTDNSLSPLLSEEILNTALCSHLLFLNQLIKQLRESKHGLSLCNTYVGAAIHADNLCTAAASKNTLGQHKDSISGGSKLIQISSSLK